MVHYDVVCKTQVMMTHRLLEVSVELGVKVCNALVEFVCLFLCPAGLYTVVNVSTSPIVHLLGILRNVEYLHCVMIEFCQKEVS